MTDPQGSPAPPEPSTALPDHPMFHGFPDDPFNEVSILSDPTLPRYHGWYGTISPSLREHLVLRLVLTLDPEAKEYNPPRDVLKCCRSEELQIFRAAQNKMEYFNNIRKKLETIRRDYYCPPWLFEMFRGDPFHKRKMNSTFDQAWQNEMMLPTRKHLRWVLAQILTSNYIDEHPDDHSVDIMDGEAETIEKDMFVRCTSRRQYYNAVAEKVLDLNGTRDIRLCALGVSKMEPKVNMEYLEPPKHNFPENRDFIRDSMVGLLHAIGCEVGRSEGASEENPKCPVECEKFQCMIAHMKICPNFELCEDRTCKSTLEIISQYQRCEGKKCETCTAVNDRVVDTPLEKQLPALFSLVKPKSRYLLHPMFFNFDGDAFYPPHFIKRDVRSHLTKLLEDSRISGKRRRRVFAKKKELEHFSKAKCREEYFELMEKEMRATGEDIREWRLWLFEGFAEDPFLGVDVTDNMVVEPRSERTKITGSNRQSGANGSANPASDSQESAIQASSSQESSNLANHDTSEPLESGTSGSYGQQSSNIETSILASSNQEFDNQSSSSQAYNSLSNNPEMVNPGYNSPGPSSSLAPSNPTSRAQKPWHPLITVEIRAHLREVLLRSFRPRNYREDFPREPHLILTKYCGGVEDKWYRTSESREAYYKSIAKSYKAIHKEIHGYEEIQTPQQYEEFFELIDVKVNMDLTDLEDEDKFLEEVSLSRKRRLVKRRCYDEESEGSDSESQDSGAGSSKKLRKLRKPAVSSAPGTSAQKRADSDGHESPSEDDEWDEKDNDLETCFLYNDRMLV